MALPITQQIFKKNKGMFFEGDLQTWKLHSGECKKLW